MRPKNIPMALSKVIIVIALIVAPLFYCGNTFAVIYWDGLLQRGVQCSGLPKELILSVIWEESHGNPNAVNVNGVASYSPPTPEQALRFIYRHNKANVDIGLMQVNWLSWGPVYKLSPADLLNPDT